jgi:DNA-directed RNA polymerase subunit RPC12/RpoP
MVRRICESFDRPFDAQEVYLKQHTLSRDQIESELARAEYLEVVTPSTKNRRAPYCMRPECRGDRYVSIAIARRTCAECGEVINPGDRMYDPRPITRHHRSLCRNCGVKILVDHLAKLVK